jgi:hypothetical protein
MGGCPVATDLQEAVAAVSSAPETEHKTPPAAENAEKLLASANDASGPARNAWLAFLGLLTYLLITLAGVTQAARSCGTRCRRSRDKGLRLCVLGPTRLVHGPAHTAPLEAA